MNDLLLNSVYVIMTMAILVVLKYRRTKLQLDLVPDMVEYFINTLSSIIIAGAFGTSLFRITVNIIGKR